MEQSLIHPVLPDKISGEQVQHNICVALSEAECLKKHSNAFSNRPTYKTVRQFSIGEVFYLFGLRKSPLYRLTQSEYQTRLPKVIVVYCTAHTEEYVAPIIVDEKLFIAHNYFRDWISCEDNEAYEVEMLNIIMSKIQISMQHSH